MAKTGIAQGSIGFSPRSKIQNEGDFLDSLKHTPRWWEYTEGEGLRLTHPITNTSSCPIAALMLVDTDEYPAVAKYFQMPEKLSEGIVGAADCTIADLQRFLEETDVEYMEERVEELLPKAMLLSRMMQAIGYKPPKELAAAIAKATKVSNSATAKKPASKKTAKKLAPSKARTR